MTDHEMPRLGLVSDNDLNRHVLKTLLLEAGYCIALSCNSDKLDEHLDTDEIDAWLLDLGEEPSVEALDKLNENSPLPLLVNDHIPLADDTEDFNYWRRRFLQKLEEVAVRRDRRSANASASEWAAHVWVLAASLGGPDAVKRFLDALEPELPIALVYAQHIEANFNQFLANIGRDSAYPAALACDEQRLQPGQVLIVPAHRELRFLPQGRVVATRKPWAGQYKPAIDQVIAEMARIYRENLGVIVFTGTCNDSEIGCRVAKISSSTIWVQSPETCTSDAMPQAALSTGGVSFQGTPEELGRELSRRYIHEKRRVNIQGPHHERRATDRRSQRTGDPANSG